MTDQPIQPQARGVRIRATPGHADIVLDGNTIPAGEVTAYSLHHSIADSLPTLVLHTRQADDTLWDGLARVAVGVSQSPGEIVTEFLAAVDPVVLEQQAMNRADYGGEAPTARAMLATLADMVSKAVG
ncbi:hypothetical protein [Streptomyces bluensis]|uniref:Uncharacterized protein n=1 Tax=Streptomyces bluensis TaxID=33897 RepID=A0ABW6UU61_9ACTN